MTKNELTIHDSRLTIDEQRLTIEKNQPYGGCGGRAVEATFFETKTPGMK
jgi:hypothetical protein